MDFLGQFNQSAQAREGFLIFRRRSPHDTRAEMLGGTFEIEAQHGNGTTVKAAVPMANGKTGQDLSAAD